MENLIAFYVVVGVIIIGLAWHAVMSRHTVLQATAPHLKRSAKKCCVCKTPQNLPNMKHCVVCGQYYCDFPPTETPRQKFETMIKGILAIILIIGTAVSIVGGLIAVVILVLTFYIPFILYLAMLPDKLPPYMKQCGGAAYEGAEFLGFRCNNCGGANTKSASHSSIGHIDRRDDYDDSERKMWDIQNSKDDDEDDNYKPSIWDGWYTKWGEYKDNDED